MEVDPSESEMIKMSRTLKKRFLLSLCALLLTSALFVVSTVAWITQLFEEDLVAEFGKVDVDIDVYFYDTATSTRTEAQAVIVDDMGNSDPGDDVTKPGVYLVNITENSNIIFADDFRVHIQILSSVPTYFRVRIIEQLTIIYTNYLGVDTEISIINDQYMAFNYTMTNWYDNRTLDNYMYYTVPVERIDALTPLEVNLIASAPVGGFDTYSPGYSLQIAFSIEAVQADGGPENVWGLPTTPWDDTAW